MLHSASPGRTRLILQTDVRLITDNKLTEPELSLQKLVTTPSSVVTTSNTSHSNQMPRAQNVKPGN